MPSRPEAINAALLSLLAEARAKEGLSMDALGKRARLDRTYVGLLERGKRQPTIVAVLALAEALGVDAVELLKQAERMVGADEADSELVGLPPRRAAATGCFESDERLRAATGLTKDVMASALEDAYHVLDLLDRELIENDAPPMAKLVELANLSSMIGNIVGGAIARHSTDLYERSGPHKYQDLRSTGGGQHVEIKTALEANKPKGHLSKAGHYLTFRYVLGNRDGTYVRGERGEVVYVWEIRFGFLNESDFSESNTEGDSGKTAVIKTDVLKAMERVYFDPSYYPMARLESDWGRRGLF